MDAETPGGSRTGTRLRPCRSFCQSVEQRCPYLLPGDRAPAYPTQYAGEPTFLCRGKRKEKPNKVNRKKANKNTNRRCRQVKYRARFGSPLFSLFFFFFFSTNRVFLTYLEERVKMLVGTLLLCVLRTDLRSYARRTYRYPPSAESVPFFRSRD